MKKYVLLDKQVGETPLQCMEKWRAEQPEFQAVPLAYAGRLDPMASGKLLVLIGEECKQQEKYHKLDKEYQFEVLFGVSSDTGDVLGLVTEDRKRPSTIKPESLKSAVANFVGPVSFSYPIFSSKPVQGKPLHTWAVERRLSEIIIPSYEAEIFSLSLQQVRRITRAALYTHVTEKIEIMPPVTDPRKSLGNDFRRPDVRLTWKKFLESGSEDDEFYIGSFTAVVSSGLYIRTLADEIAKNTGTRGLAYSIHRTRIGRAIPLPLGITWWRLP